MGFSKFVSGNEVADRHHEKGKTNPNQNVQHGNAASAIVKERFDCGFHDRT
jgi:hypothetical protein